MGALISMQGQTFGRLTVVAQEPSTDQGAIWLCQCECGNTARVNGKKLRNGHSKSCGCLRADVMLDNRRQPNEPAPDGPLTQERLKEVLEYDPASGNWRWKVRTSWRVETEGRAGTINSHGYVAIKVDRKLYRAHRLAWLYMTGQWPNEIDHKDRNKANCAWANLRSVTHAENMMNVCRR